MKIAALLFLCMSAFAQHAMLPDPSLTPGDTNPNVTQSNIGKTICRAGYTATIRNVSESLKKQVMLRYHLPLSDLSRVEIDHNFSLELGGSNNITNLWPQYYDPAPLQTGYLGARSKDVVETWLHRQICAGNMTLADAQKAIHTWPAWYSKIKAQ